MNSNLKRHICVSGLKHFVAIFIVILIVLSAITISAFALTDETYSLTKDDLLNMDKGELLTTMEDNGLWLPSDFVEHRTELAEPFVYKYVHMLLEGKTGFDNVSFEYEQSNIAFKNLINVLLRMGFSFETRMTSVYSVAPMSTKYSLKNSTAIGTWSESYTKYNCYAYAIGKTSWIRIGEPSGKKDQFSITMPISQIADFVIADLDKMGYLAYKTTTKPTSLPDVHFKVICVRKGADDYHFMKQNGSNVSYWTHKPSVSQPLKWNYASPAAAIWTNERVQHGIAFEPTVRYDSTIYYILYKKKGSHGLQSTEYPWCETVFENAVYSNH